MMIMLWLRNVLGYIVVASASTASVRWLESDIADKILLPNITGIILALLAINVSTISATAVKLHEIGEKHQIDFSASIAQFRLAISEQTVLILISIVIAALQTSKRLEVPEAILHCAGFAIFFASLHIFVDTSRGLLVVLFPQSDR